MKVRKTADHTLIVEDAPWFFGLMIILFTLKRFAFFLRQGKSKTQCNIKASRALRPESVTQI